MKVMGDWSMKFGEGHLGYNTSLIIALLSIALQELGFVDFRWLLGWTEG